ncbi:hypothetical protein [Asticcacaulis sp.]|uniref:hypothetical protein n=1 Tax=Asticcacaulis sp. TaxID=1872648 RepID=UPI003F7C7029
MARKIFEPALVILVLLLGLSVAALTHPTPADAGQAVVQKAVFDQIALNRLGR